MVLFEDPTVTVKCRTAIKELLFHFNLCLSVMFDSLSCSFTYIAFPTEVDGHFYDIVCAFVDFGAL